MNQSEINAAPMSRLEHIAQEIRAVDNRDLHMWSIGLLVMLVVAGGFMALVFPNVMWGIKDLRVDDRYLPQLFFGFVALIVLFNIYAMDKKRALQHARSELVRQLIRSEAAEMLSLVDPLTNLFNRRYLDEIISKEASRASRYGSELTLMMIDVDAFKSVNTRFGHLFGDQVLTEVANLLKKNFRNSDIVVRYGGDEFLVILPETSETEGQRAIERLQSQVDAWNRNPAFEGYKMSLSCGLASFTGGKGAREVIEMADSQMYLHKNRKFAAV
ncbi:MAG TPA: GGDEF domain-containing protein [Terriglobia bacterium]|nr:GGDEF domain-containing protein [Terriglobia bacterium]